MSLFSSNRHHHRHQRGRSSSRSPLSSLSLLVLAVATFLTIFVPSKVAASKTKNRAILKEKYGIDCGTHCTNAVVKLHEAKIEQEKYVASFLARIFLFVGVCLRRCCCCCCCSSFFLSLSRVREIRDRVFERRKRHRASSRRSRDDLFLNAR